MRLSMRWRRPSIVLAVLLLLALCSVVVVVWWLRQARIQAEAYARDATEAVVTDWSSEALQARAAADLIDRTTPEGLSSYLAFLDSQLGRLRSIRDLRTTGSTVHVRSNGLVVVVTVTVTAEFEKGAAVLRWLLARQGGSWKVSALQAESDHIKVP
jgi:hypothetical protein